MTSPARDSRLLVVSEVGAGPPYEGNRARMAMLLDNIRALGYQIHFAGVGMRAAERDGLASRIDRWVTNFSNRRLVLRPSGLSDRIRWRLEQAGMLSHDSRRDLRPLDARMDMHWVGELQAIQAKEHYPRVLVSYVFHSAFLEALPSTCLKVLDTHDIFGNRRERLEAAGLTNNWLTLTVADERRGLLRADRILAIQDAERTYFDTLLGGERIVRTVGHMCAARLVEPVAGFETRIGYFASDNSLNVESLEWFLESCWPSLVAHHPAASLIVGGRVCRTLRSVPAGVEIMGEMRDPADLYARCLFVINPMRGGTGLKIKTVEALAAGRTVVAFEAGAAGLAPVVGRGLTVAATPADFVNACARALSDPVGTTDLGRRLPAALEVMSAGWRTELHMALER